ncbi:MAG: glycosyltransferase family 2 protein [Rubricoccaceae bacterium]
MSAADPHALAAAPPDARPARAPVSVLLLTLNEEANLPRCLAALDWADDVLVLDSFSTDRTVAVAQEHGARVMQRAFDSFAGQRNFGLQEGGLRHDWVLHLDADEVVTPALRDELLKVMREGTFPAYRLASKMMFQGRWLRYSGLYPSYQVRFGRRDRLTFVQVGHGQRETLAPEELGTLQEPLLHYTFSKGLDDWIARHNRYSRAEAEEALAGGSTRVALRDFIAKDPVERRRAAKRLVARSRFRPALRYAYMLLARRAFLDGTPGLTYCRLLAMYERMIVLKMREIELKRKGVPL